MGVLATFYLFIKSNESMIFALFSVDYTETSWAATPVQDNFGAKAVQCEDIPE